jgi:hypothetical protein
MEMTAMTKTKPNQQGRKTKEQQRRTLERKPDLPREDADGEIVADGEDDGREARAMDRSKRQSEFAVSHGGMNQESQHNKHRADE